MDRENILQLFFETINESLEWGVGDESYCSYVDGCVAMTDKLLEKIDKKVYSETNCKNTHDASSIPKLQCTNFV